MIASPSIQTSFSAAASPVVSRGPSLLPDTHKTFQEETALINAIPLAEAGNHSEPLPPPATEALTDREQLAPELEQEAKLHVSQEQVGNGISMTQMELDAAALQELETAGKLANMYIPPEWLAMNPELDMDSKANLRAYTDYRLARGEQPFAYLEISEQRNQAKEHEKQRGILRKLYAGTDQMAEAYPPAGRHAFEAHFADSPDPARDKMQTANLQFMEVMTGVSRDELTRLWPAYRDRYAAEYLGIKGPLDEAGFYAAAGKALEEDEKDASIRDTVFQKARLSAIQGRPLADTLNTTRDLTKDRFPYFEKVARAGHASILADFTDEAVHTSRGLFEFFGKIKRGSPEDISTQSPDFANYARMSPEDRNQVLLLVSEQAQAEGKDVEGYFRELDSAFSQGTDSLSLAWLSKEADYKAKYAKSILQLGVIPTGTPDLLTGTFSPENLDIYWKDYILPGEHFAFSAHVPTRPLTGQERTYLQAAEERSRGESMFLMDAQSAGVRMQRYNQKRSDSWFDPRSWSILIAESTPLMTVSALPGIGYGLEAMSYEQAELARLRQSAPHADPAELEKMASVTGFTMAGISRVSHLFSAAKYAPLNKALGRFTAISRPLAAGQRIASQIGGVRYIGRPLMATARVAGRTALEVGEEVSQDLTGPAFQEVVAALHATMPGQDWHAIMERERQSMGDLTGVCSMLSIITGMGGKILDTIELSSLKETLSDRQSLALAGYRPETVEAIATLAEKDPAAAADLLKASSTQISVEERRKNSAAVFERYTQERSPTPAQAELPTVHPQEDGSILIKYPDGTQDIAQSEQDATQALGTWESDQSTAREEGIRSYLRYLEGTHSANPELQAQGHYTGKEQDLHQWAAGSQEKIEIARNRVAIAMRQSGITLSPEEQADLSKHLILGSSRNTYQNGVTTMALEVNKVQAPGSGRSGATILTPIEEHGEGIAKWLLDTGKKSTQWFIDNIRATEAASDVQTLPDNLMDLHPDVIRQNVIEAFSRLAVGNAVGRIHDSTLPSGLKAIFRAFKETIHSVLSLAADIKRFRDAGHMDQDFAYWLDTSSGINEDYKQGYGIGDSNTDRSSFSGTKTSDTTFSLTSKDALRLQHEILEQPATELSTEGIPTDMRAKDAVKYAIIRGTIGQTRHDIFQTEKDVNGEISIGKSGIKHAVSQTLHTDKMAVLEEMKSIIPSAIFIDTFPKKPQLTSYRFAAKVSIDGAQYVARIIVNSDHTGNRYYNHELSDLTKLKQEKENPQPHEPGEAIADTRSGKMEIEDTHKLLQFIFSVNENDIKTATQTNSDPESTQTVPATDDTPTGGGGGVDLKEPAALRQKTGMGRETSFSIAPIGAGPKPITEAPKPVSLSNPFPEHITQPSELRKEFWKNFDTITKNWPKIINTPEGPIAWSKAKTGNKLRVFKDGEPAALHYMAAAQLPELLKSSTLAAVENEGKGDRTVAEVHKRYAWADFPNGERRNILLTIDRMSDHADQKLQDADQAYSSEVLGVTLEVLPENKKAASSEFADSVSNHSTTTGDIAHETVNHKIGEGNASSNQVRTSGRNSLTRFLSGIKQEHRHPNTISENENPSTDAIVEAFTAIDGIPTDIHPETRKSVDTKLTTYLLNYSHIDGGPKAKWFEKALGFTKENYGELAKQLIFDPLNAVETQKTQYGQKYNLPIEITGINGRKITVRTSWIKDENGIIRLITAVPTNK